MLALPGLPVTTLREYIMKRIILVAALAAFALPATAQAIGLGLGQIGPQALSGTVQGVQSETASGSLAALAGITAGGATSGQTASGIGGSFGTAGCNGNDCASVAGNAQQNSTLGQTQTFGAALGLAGSLAAGGSSGQSIGESIGSGQTLYNYGSIFVSP